MSYGILIFNSLGDLRLDLSTSLVHYLGNVTKIARKPNYNEKYILDFVCPVPYSGRMFCVINSYNPFVPNLNYPPTNITGTSDAVVNGVYTLQVPSDYNRYTDATVTVHFLGI